MTVHLTVDTASELSEAVLLTNSSCGRHGQVDCTQLGSVSSTQLNITASPPEGCAESCPWYWLWYPCRCHAAANLTVVLPHNSSGSPTLSAADVGAAQAGRGFGRGSGRGSSAAAAAAAAAAADGGRSLAQGGPPADDTHQGGLPADDTYGRTFLDLSVRSRGSSAVVVKPGLAGLGRLLDRVDVASQDGDVRIERVFSMSSLSVHSANGLVFLEGVYGGSELNASGAALVVDTVIVAQVCDFVKTLRGLPLNAWAGGDACASLPIPVGPLPPNRTYPTAVALGTMRLRAAGGSGAAVILNGTIGAARTHIEADAGLVKLSDARFVGSLDVEMRSGTASLVNVVTLDCALCKDQAELHSLSWGQLPLSPAANLFCTCDTPSRGFSFLSSEDAKLSASFVIANRIVASSKEGNLGFSEVVLLPSTPSHNGTVGALGPPMLNGTSTYGDVTLINLIAESTAAATVVVHMGSMAGVVKGLFTGVSERQRARGCSRP